MMATSRFEAETTSSPPTLVIIPTYNEVDNAPAIAAAVFEAAPAAQILFVDDGSPDGTGAVIDAMAAQDSRVHVLHRVSKLGLGTAYLAGFDWGLARGFELLVQMDADFSHDPRHLTEMIARIGDGADLVVGSRYVPGGGTENWGLLRQMISRGGGLYARGVLGLAVRDITAGFVCWRREALERLELQTVQSEGYGFQIELKYRALRRGLRLDEIPIIFVDRRVGQSKMSSRIFQEAVLLVWRLRGSGW